MDFTQNEYVKLDETLIDTQRSYQGKTFERHGRSWIFDLQTLQNMTNTSYIHHSNSFKELITS